MVFSILAVLVLVALAFAAIALLQKGESHEEALYLSTGPPVGSALAHS